FAPKQLSAGIRGRYWWAVHIIEQPFDQVAGWSEILESLLILNAYGGAAKLIRKPDRGNVHLTLLQSLSFGKLGFLVVAPAEGHAFLPQPAQDLARLGVADALHRGEERGLAEPLLEQPGWVQQFIRNNGVEHAHAPLVEYAENR